MEDVGKKLDKMDEKLEMIDGKLSAIDKTLIEQAGQLRHHIYRTDLAEQHLKLLESQIQPLTDFLSKFNGVMKFVGVIATGIAMVVGILKIFESLF